MANKKTDAKATREVGPEEIIATLEIIQSYLTATLFVLKQQTGMTRVTLTKADPTNDCIGYPEPGCREHLEAAAVAKRKRR